MCMKKILYAVTVVLLISNIVLCVKLTDLRKELSARTATKQVKNHTVYSNPIDAYFLPRIKYASCEIEVRVAQDKYLIVWSNEFEKIIKMMKAKCKYQKDKDVIDAYKKGINDLFDKTSSVLVTEWLDDYQLDPNSPNRGSWGNGTRSGLNQIRAEKLRNECLMLMPYCKNYTYPNPKEFSKIVIP